MSVEELFVKEYEKLIKKNNELEMENKLLRIEKEFLENKLEQCAEVFKKAKPSITVSNNLWLGSIMIFDTDKDKIVKLLQGLKVEINKDNKEVEKR